MKQIINGECSVTTDNVKESYADMLKVMESMLNINCSHCCEICRYHKAMKKRKEKEAKK